MNRCVLPVVMSALIGLGNLPIALAASSEPQLNFKIYSPESNDSAKEEATTAPAETPAPAAEAAAPAGAAEATMPAASTDSSPPAADAVPAPASSQGYTPPAAEAKGAEAAPDASTSDAPTLRPEAPTPAAEASPAAESKSSLQAETPTEAPAASTAAAPAKTDDLSSTEAKAGTMNGEAQTSSADSSGTDDTKKAEGGEKADGGEKTEKTADGKALQGYIRVVPEGTKIPIIMDTAVDSDTSQEGDEFTARTSEDLNIDGAVAVPAGSIIKGRIAQMNAPKHLDRSGSVALKFDTVTTPDNRQIPLVANLVSHGGVVHARRGLKDIAIDSSTVLIPTLVGLAIGAIAGKSNSSTSTSTTSTSTSSITKPEAAMIGVGIGLAVGVAILCAKKGKKVDVRPGDELKIQLSEALRMPMM